MTTPERDRFDDLPILAELRDQLEGRVTRTARPMRRGLTAGIRLLPTGVAVATALAVAVIALVALGHRHDHAGGGTANRHTTPVRRPPHGRLPRPSAAELRRQAEEQRYINAAQAQVVALDHACKQKANQGATFSGTSPGRELLSLLAVMRRPALPADASTRTLMNGGFDIGAGVYRNYIRRGLSAYGKSYYLVPEARTTPFSPIPARCDAKIMAALHTRVRGLAPKLRELTVAQEAGSLSVLHEETRHQEGLCFAVVSHRHKPGPNGVDMGCGQGFAQLQRGGGINIIENDHAGGRIMAGVVSDRVATATLRYPAGNGRPARSITVRPVNNVVVFKVPPDTFHIDNPTTILRTATGAVIPQPTLTQVSGG
jgi:hypothetical protein